MGCRTCNSHVQGLQNRVLVQLPVVVLTLRFAGSIMAATSTEQRSTQLTHQATDDIHAPY